MAGLLDGAYSPDPLSMGLLGLGSALMTPRALGGGIGPGMQAFNQGAMQAQLMRRQQQQDALREQLFMAQMDNYRSEAEQRKAAADERRQATERARAQTEGQRRVLESFAGPQPGFRDASIAITGNAPAGYVPPEQRGGQITREMAAAWVANGGDLATLQKLAESPNFGLPEVARVLERRGADNTPEQVREDKYGRPIGAAVPKPFTMQMQDIGGSVVPVNPYAPTALPKTFTPGERDASARGWASVRNAESRLRFDMEQARGGAGGAGGVDVQYIQTPQGIVAVPKKPGEGPITGRTVTDQAGMVMGGDKNTSERARVTDATDALALVREAEKLIDRSTGSYGGVAVDSAAQVFGVSTRGAQAAAQLKALEGALIAKMPKMSGPQSDKDVLLYKQMAGQVGDPTIPAQTKRAALQTIREIQSRYANSGGATGEFAPASDPLNVRGGRSDPLGIR